MGRQLATLARFLLALLGILLVVGAFGAVLYLGMSANPPPLRIAVVNRDISIGERISTNDYRIVDQILDPRLAQLYVQEVDVAQFDGAVVVDLMRRGDPLNKVKLAARGPNDAAFRRYAIALGNPDDVLMTLPVNPDIIPDKLVPGDYINILFTGGPDTGVNQLPDNLVGPIESSITAITDSAAISPTVVPMPTAIVVLPMADILLAQVPILDVNREQLQNARYAGDAANSEQPFIEGRITSIVVRVPRRYQTLLMFGVTTSKLRYAIASPLFDAKKIQPEMGMDWRKYMDAYRWKEAQVLARGETLTQTLFPSIAATPTLTNSLSQ